MSSATSDSTNKTFVHVITGYVAQIQRECIFTRQRCESIRTYFFQSIGLSIVLYFVFQLPFIFYSILQLLVRVIFSIFTVMFWPPLQALQFILPKSTSYGILLPLFPLLAVVSFILAKFFMSKRYKASKHYSFAFAFLLIFLLQTVFILRPIALSIHELRKSSLTLSAHHVVSNGIADKQMSSRLVVESDVKDKHSTLLGHDKLVGEQFASSLPLKKTAPGPHPNGNGGSMPESRAQSARKVSKQGEKSLPSVSKSPVADREWLIHRQRFLNWLDEAWNIWDEGKFIHSLSTVQMQHLPRHRVSSIYTAYTDEDCHEHTKSIDRQQLAKSKHLNVLDSYRRRAPFPVYLSVLESNGPKCYGRYPDSSCANSSRRIFAHFSKFLYSFGLFWMIVSIPLLVFVLIVRYYQHHDKSRSIRKHEIISKQTDILPLQQLSAPTTENDALFEEMENDLRSWLEREQRAGYRNMSETYRQALNDKCLKKHVSNYKRTVRERRPRCSHDGQACQC